MTALFVIETGRILGYTQLPYDSASHTALFCPDCGQIWARILYEGAESFYVKHKHCMKHGDGSFFLSTDALDSIQLSDELAQYEAEITLLHPDRYQQNHRWPILSAI